MSVPSVGRGIALPNGRLYVPVEQFADRRKLLDALGIMVDENDARAQALLSASYMLVRNDGPERWRCQWCNVRHEHYTTQCIPRPWRGLQHALYGYWRNTADVRPSDLTAAQRQRMNELGRVFGKLGRAEPISVQHPRTARELGTAEGDVDYGATILGSLDPITPQKAMFYAELIRARGVAIRI